MEHHVYPCWWYKPCGLPQESYATHVSRIVCSLRPGTVSVLDCFLLLAPGFSSFVGSPTKRFRLINESSPHPKGLCTPGVRLAKHILPFKMTILRIYTVPAIFCMASFTVPSPMLASDHEAPTSSDLTTLYATATASKPLSMSTSNISLGQQQPFDCDVRTTTLTTRVGAQNGTLKYQRRMSTTP